MLQKKHFDLLFSDTVYMCLLLRFSLLCMYSAYFLLIVVTLVVRASVIETNYFLLLVPS